MTHQDSQVSDILAQLRNKKLLVVNPRRRNGIILYKKYYTEFAGPGAAIGYEFDYDCDHVLPVGNLSLLNPQSSQERQRAFLIRRQWIRLIRQITDNPVSLERGQILLNQFENWFDSDTEAKIPNTAFAGMVGILPQTLFQVRKLGAERGTFEVNS